MTWDDETKARAAGMKRAGMTNKQIAERLGCPPGQVKRNCLKIGAYRHLDHASGKWGKPARARYGIVGGVETVDDLP